MSVRTSSFLTSWPLFDEDDPDDDDPVRAWCAWLRTEWRPHHSMPPTGKVCTANSRSILPVDMLQICRRRDSPIIFLSFTTRKILKKMYL
jgi:hypothetical protein